MSYGSDTERATPARPGRDPVVGRASIGGFVYCVVTGLGVGAFVGEPLAGTIAGTVLGVPASLWLVPAAIRERHEYWRDR